MEIASVLTVILFAVFAVIGRQAHSRNKTNDFFIIRL